jgi:hypothetical protein
MKIVYSLGKLENKWCELFFMNVVTLVQNRIQLFTLMLLRIRTQLFILMRIQIQLLIKVIRICDHWSTDPRGLHFDFNADPDPDTASKINEDLDM